jgi:predicted DNA-binding protein
MVTPTTTVRLSIATRNRLRRLSEQRGLSSAAVIEDLVVREEEQDEARSWAEDLHRLLADQVQAYRAELATKTAGAVRGSAITNAAAVEQSAATAPNRAPQPAAPVPSTPYSVRIPADVTDAWRARVADAGINQSDAVTAAFRAFIAMDVDDFTTAVLADKRRRRNDT